MSQFAKLADKYAALAQAPSKIAELARSQIEDNVQQEFSTGSDIYGRPWKARKDGSPSRLEQSGALRGSLKVQINGTSIEISFSDYKFAFHQSTRPMLSIGIMPEKWSKAIESSFAQVMSQK